MGTTDTNQALKQTALFSEHQALGAKMTPFSGFDMPVWYEGLKQEHLAVRTTCGMFDISHMGCFDISGPDAQPFLQKISCNDVKKSKVDTMVYAMALNHNGYILDDIMFGKLPNSYYLVVNAGNKQKMADWMQAISSEFDFNVTIQDLNPDHGFLAIQGPQSEALLTKTLGYDFSSIHRFRVRPIESHGVPIVASRTGYTGEDGFELLIPNEAVSTVWQTLVQAGIKPCGLGARDSLRIEAGLPLYGQELSETITPLETRYKWVVSFDSDFIGNSALKQKQPGTSRTTVGFKMEDRIIPRAHYPIKEGGEVTSGTLSPSLGEPVGMALVSTETKDNGYFHVHIRGKYYKANIVDVPFLA